MPGSAPGISGAESGLAPGPPPEADGDMHRDPFRLLEAALGRSSGAGEVGECLGVVSGMVSLDFDQRSAQETVAMPRVNAVKSDFSKSLGPRERHKHAAALWELHSLVIHSHRGLAGHFPRTVVAKAVRASVHTLAMM